VNWAGELHSYLVDAHGNMREDTNLNHQLDVADDLFVVFDQFSIGTVHKYHDDNANSILEDSEKSDGTVGTMADIKFLWSTSDWLNNITDANIVDQRSPYMTADANRYIFTFIDGKAGAGDLNMLPDTDEVVAFVDTEPEFSDISPYIHVYPPFQSAPWGLEPRRLECAASAADCGPFNDFLTHQSQRVIDYIRGKDQGQYTSSTTPSYTIPPFRNRVVGEGGVAPSKTWRLGDIVYSTPTVVGSPAEDLDLLYKDDSYSVFFLQYRNRRNVIYAGGNDGMLHAFNAGFYDSTGLHFWRAMNGATTPPTYSDSGPALGAELWGYVPYNLLPHLYWLTESAYNQNSHVAYVDLKPRIFDAKIFHDDATHPGGWGTVLVGGMRLGGGKIRADIDKTDGLNYNNGVDRTMGPAFFIMDITDPEQPPTLMAEISAEQLGFTTCYPTVVTMKSTSSATPNQWYLMLGSGPYMGPNTADYTSALNNASSNQSAKIVLLDLNELGTNHHIRSVADASPASNRTLENGIHFFAALDANSFISDPISVDFDLDYKTDVAYFGTVQGSFNADDYWGGKVRRVVFNDSADFSQWVNDSTLLDLTHLSGGSGPGEPIVAALSAAMDSNGQRWVFVGTGRFFNRLDAAQVPASAHQQSYYGIKEPFVVSGLQKAFSWGAADRAKLLDVTNAQVFEGGNTVLGINEPSPDPYPLVPISNFDALKAHMNAIDTGTHSNVLDGWFLNFTTSKERNLGQATLLGDILTFTSYMPSVDPCVIEGSSDLYALYFSTGTAYKKAVFKGDIGLDINSSTTEPGGAVKFEVNKKTHLGQGLTITPNIHTGREEGSRVYVQTSTGTILELEEANPGMTKSGKTSWEEWRD
jgi:type IV pilus assembly protein PilY1